MQRRFPLRMRSFDVVTSLIGAMFAPRPDLVAKELLRVCKPGGIIAMANWTPQGFVGQMFKAVSKFIAPSGMPSPVLWGDETTVRERLGQGTVGSQPGQAPLYVQLSFSAGGRGGTLSALLWTYSTRRLRPLTPMGVSTLRRELEALWASHNRAGIDSTTVFAEYLEVIGVRA